jgi:c-di-GMP-related signal transduction protein
VKQLNHPAGSGNRSLTDVCVARQPIFGTAGEVAGYELLYRRSGSDKAAGTSVNRNGMGADGIVHAFLNMGLEGLTTGRAAYVNFTREMLLSGAYALLPAEHVVIELLAEVEPDDDVETACEQLVDAGYALALDDFAGSAEFGRLLELATVVKVDVLDVPAKRLDEIAQQLAPYDVRLLAERVETANVRATCAGLGYELFQGYFFAQPEVAAGRGLVSDDLAIVQAVNVLRDPNASDSDAEAVIGTDVGLSYRLLRMVNSAARSGREVESIRHAVELTGRNELAKSLALLLVSSIAARGAAHRELLHLAVHRARLCELLAGPVGPGRDGNASFLVGLISLLDAIAGMPMTDLLESMALAPPIRAALVERTGPYAGPLTLAEAYERGEWTAVVRQASSLGLDVSQVGQLYVQSLAWTRARLLSLTAG